MKPGDKVRAFCPNTKDLTHGKQYVVRQVKTGGRVIVKNDKGEYKVYSCFNFKG